MIPKTRNQQNIVLRTTPPSPDSLAEGIIATESYSAPKAILALKNSKGMMISVTDEEIITAHKEIIELESIIPEITSAVVYAALKKMNSKANEKIVCINTGSGLKDINKFIK